MATGASSEPFKPRWPRLGENCSDRLANSSSGDRTSPAKSRSRRRVHFQDPSSRGRVSDSCELATSESIPVPRTDPTTVAAAPMPLQCVQSTDLHSKSDRGPSLHEVTSSRPRLVMGVCGSESASQTVPDPSEIRQCLEQILLVHEAIRDLRVEVALVASGYRSVKPRCHTDGGLDLQKMAKMTALADYPGRSMKDVIRLARGETDRDPRPNKALRPTDYRWLLAGYRHCGLMVAAATHGLQPSWLLDNPCQPERPENHRSALRFAPAVARSIRSGQDGGQYLVVSDRLLEKWTGIQISPLGAVEKKDVDPNVEVRLIHDLKRPIGSSTNEATNRLALPALTYRPVAELARRIDELHAKDSSKAIRMMKGDVKGAFRHLMLSADSVGWMGARLQDQQALLLDLSAPFGWTSSPTYYGVFGGAITWLVQQESPASLSPSDCDDEPFYGYEWVDDHVLIEHDTGDRLKLAAIALRTGMMAVFGPRALNEKKFSAWESRLEVLGLEFDLINRTISMPESKIEKACGRLSAMQAHVRTTRAELLKLLGSLRHVCTCSRAVKPFYQRLQALSAAAPLYGSMAIPDSVRQDLTWCLALLKSGQFRDLPTTMFGAWPRPDIHLYMDASNMGLAVLDPAVCRYIQLKFNQEEIELINKVGDGSAFTINVREQLSVALAASVWGPTWSARFQGTIGHVWCWIDNSTAVAVTNKLASRNEMAQELNRRIGYAEAVYGFRVRCLHLPGKLNTMADAASRAWAPPFANMWATMKQGWQQDPVPESLRTIYVQHSEDFNAKAWQPADHSEQLALFATHCWISPPDGRGNAPTTIMSKISAISWRHRLDRGYPVGLHQGHLLAVQGMRRVSAPPAAKAPATIPLLHALRSRCNFSVTHDRVLWGATVVGYFYLLRSSEYLSVNGKVAPTALVLNDITLRDAFGRICDVADQDSVVSVDVRLRGSKTDQEGRTKILSLERTGSGWLCPVLAVLDLLSNAAGLGLLPSSPLMSTSPGQVVRANTLNQALRRAAMDCGIAADRVGTHSLRAGGATAMMTAGVDLQTIKQFGRWASDSVDRYTRLTAATSRALAAQMIARPAPGQPQALNGRGSALHPATELEAQPRSYPGQQYS